MMSWKQRIISLSMLLLGGWSVSGQVLINELCASNDETILDEYGESSDWIELYNAGEETADLSGHYLSDDLADPSKWQLPNITLSPEEFLLIFASDRDEYGVNLHTNFKLSAGGESVLLSDENGMILDQIQFPELGTDQSMGRLPDGSPQWALFSAPTPNGSNDDAAGSGFTDPPSWETTGHFFDNATSISLSHPDANARIYFTRDGSMPSETDELYAGAIQVDTTTAIRAVAIVDGKLPSVVASRTFFIDDEHNVPVVSIIGEPDNFWSWEYGILVDGGPNAEEEWPFWGANYWSEEEYPIHAEFFTEDGDLGIAFAADTEVHGGRGARTRPMKPLRILVKKKYGSSTIEYPFFPDRERTTYKRLVLRNASGDYNNAHMRDAFLARYFIQNGLNLDVLAHRPAAVFINGVYYGQANLREKSDVYYLKHNYGVDIDEVDLLEEDTIVVAGDFVAFDSMYQYVIDHDLSQDEYFQQANAYFDTENIAEGFIVQSALNNGDWLHNNTKYWRERKADARWRYFIFDLDIAMGRHGWSDYYNNNLDSLISPLARRGNRHALLFERLLANEGYRHYFVNRYADLFNTIFRPENFRAEVDRSVAEIDPEMPRHFSRWTWPGYNTWKNDRVQRLYDYLEERPAHAREDVQEYFGLSNQVELALQTFPPEAGRVRVNTIESVDLPWDGIYFNGVPVELEILPNPGFTFSHWQSENTILEPDANTTIRYNFEIDDRITAHFSDAPDGMVMKTFVDADQQLQILLQLPEAKQVSLGLYDMSGRFLQPIDEASLSVGLQTYELPVADLPAGMYVVSAFGNDEVVSSRFVVF